MSFKIEEELETWFLAEKDRLAEEFTRRVDDDKDNIPKHKSWFDAQMKKLLAKYNSEYEKFLKPKMFEKKTE